MEANKIRHIQNGYGYDYLFPEATGKIFTVKKDASLSNTIAFIPKVVHECAGQTVSISTLLKADNVFETCSNIWHFVYNHIQYKRDKDGYEQIRSPARTWRDRKSGVDCDCYSVFISTILLNLQIPYVLRITKYKQNYFQHIYPVVHVAGREIILDCVTNEFDYEVPFSEKKDYNMDLQFLSGLDDALLPEHTIVANGVGDLGKIRLKGLLNKLNKFNPVTVLLRNGILVAMKLNIGNVAKRLRWSYLAEADAVKKGIDVGQLNKIVSVRQKLESIFYGAGGKTSNLKKAMLKGKGNKDKAVVAGLGSIDLEGVEDMNINTPLAELLGDIYDDENTQTFKGVAGFGELGEPATLASLTAASAVIMKIVGALKKVGNIFKGNAKEAEDFDEKKNKDAEKEISIGKDDKNSPTDASSTSETPPSSNSLPSSALTTPGTTTSVISPSASPEDKPDDDPNDKPVAKNGLWDSNKKWLKPILIGTGGLAVLVVGYQVLKTHYSSQITSSLSGTPKKHNKKRLKKNNKHHPPKAPIELL